MATISNNDIAYAIYLISKGKTHSQLVELCKKVVKFLFKRRLLSKADGILMQLEKIINREEGRVAAKITSAKILDHQTKARLEQILKKRYSAKEVMLIESLDEKLLGGLKIEVNNEVIDLSIRNKIEKLQEHLIKSA